MIVKNPSDTQVGPYQFKDDTYGPIPAGEQISGVPTNVAYWMRDSIHNFLTVLPEAKIVSNPKVEKKEETSQLSQPLVTEVKTETTKAEKPKTK